ncbi:MAG: hypothetical protein GC201_13475 [Alphaproteobacteria bacterium]|nr:hypothetical protein [Alphaproteobacteria bacterium]
MSKLAVGLMVGLVICFLFPGKHAVRPLSAAILGVVGAALGAFLAQQLLAIGDAGITVASLCTAGIGATAFVLAYVATSH